MASVADAFGIDLSGAARKAAERRGFKLVYDKSYPLGTQDMTPILNEVKALNADVFVAFSYPPDTLGLTDQARVAGFNPKVFYVGVGTAFPVFKARFKDNVDGVMGIGGVNFDSPAISDYFARHKAASGKEPDRWASAVTYAGLQLFQQAIERVGRVDRAAVIAEMKKRPYDTIVGKMEPAHAASTRATGWSGNGRTASSTASRPQTAPARTAPSCRSRRGSRRGSSRRALMPLVEILVAGLVLGGMYALVAMGLTLQYGVARIMNLRTASCSSRPRSSRGCSRAGSRCRRCSRSASRSPRASRSRGSCTA